jgi:hypothetical protein
MRVCAIGNDLGVLVGQNLRGKFINAFGRERLNLDLGQSEYRRLSSATDAIVLPEPKPRAMRVHLVVPSIRSRDVACAEWSNVRRFEHFL